MTKKHTLLATTGASPQVVTETLYAIHHENQQWPDDIYLITTSFGKRKAVEGLLEQKHLQRLCHELQRPIPAFDATHILVTPGADGTEVEDARSLEDHEALGDFIMAEVRKRTLEDNTSLHTSLAGGRKTMTFYMGYAMSLFGRPQDTLSHVLISEGYENVPGFWFPTQTEPHRYVDSRGQKLDASLAEVTLAPIPFVRLRDGLPQKLLSGDKNFTQTVAAIQDSLLPPRLQIYREPGKKKPTVVCGQKTIQLSPLQLTWLIWLAELTKEGRSIKAPKEDSEGKSSLSAERFLEIYGHIDDPKCFPYTNTSSRQVVAEYSAKYKGMKTNLAYGIYKSFFERELAKLEKAIRKELGQYQAAHYLIHREGGYGDTSYRLALPAEAIFIELD